MELGRAQASGARAEGPRAPPPRPTEIRIHRKCILKGSVIFKKDISSHTLSEAV